MAASRGAVLAGNVVAVTGASGFIGSHICKCLLDRGFRVRAVVRNKDDAAKVAHLQALAAGLPADRLAFFNGDLTSPGSYDEAFEGADGVIHSAAVVDIMSTKDAEKQLVRPTIEGTRNVLHAMDKSSSVKRLVHTSSIAALMSADRPSGAAFTVADWNAYSTVANGDPYGYAKTQAERLVHRHVAEGCPYDFVALHPGIVLGPCLAKAHTKASPFFVRQMLFGNEQLPLFVSLVDVRDVAQAHVEALMRPHASRQRFALVSGPSMWLADLGPILQQQLPQYLLSPRFTASYKVSVLCAVSQLGFLLTPFQRHMLTKQFNFGNTPASQGLDIKFRGVEEMVRDTALSMVQAGWVKPKLKAKV
eukprot:EG_transcript_14232